MTDNGQGAVIRPVTIADLKPPEFLVAECNTMDGRKVQIAFQNLTMAEWDAEIKQVRNPDPKKYNKLADDGETLIPNPQDPRYLKAVEDATLERQARIVVMALEKKNPDLFTGETPVEKWENFVNAVDKQVGSELIRIIMASHTQGRAVIQSLAATFQASPIRAGADENPPEAELVGVGSPNRRAAN